MNLPPEIIMLIVGIVIGVLLDNKKARTTIVNYIKSLNKKEEVRDEDKVKKTARGRKPKSGDKGTVE